MTAVDTRPTTATARLGFAGVLRSELGKLGSLRSIRIAAVCTVLLVVAGMALRAFAFAQVAASVPVGVPAGPAWREVVDTGLQAGRLAAVVLAALAVGSEYRDRAALSTFTAAPRRLLVLAAKAVALLVPAAALVAGGLVAGALLSAPMMDAAALSAPLPAVLAAAVPDLVVVLATTVLAFSLTLLTRSTAAGITVVLAVLLVLPVAAALLGQVLGTELAPFLLTYAAPMAAALHDPAGTGALVRDVVVTAAWLVVPAGAAAAALVRRDV